MSNPDLVLLHAPSVYDFREQAILYGPISDLIPSTPVFEMYPIGFITIAHYLERHGYRVRIVNLAVRMLQDEHFDADKLIASLNPLAFGIDLHWLPHAQGALEVAKTVKKHHPQTPLIMGGLSASYYHQELLSHPEVDYVVRGDSAEEPLRRLMTCLERGVEPADVPNLTWRDEHGEIRVNPLTHAPVDLDGLGPDYGYVVKAVVQNRDLSSHIPFTNWLEYPIMTALTCRGCTHNCVTCGGSAHAFRNSFGRTGPAYRPPEALADDLKKTRRFSNGPLIVLGDIRQPGQEYAQHFLRAIKGIKDQIIIELFTPASRGFLEDVASAIPNFCLEISLESHDPAVRRAFGKTYTNEAIERTMGHALDVGCQRLDLFFMIGLPEQTYQSVMDTISYCEALLRRFDGDKRLRPFISPLAPFLDPGSLVFENPKRYGYRLFYRTLEEHRRALLSPSWKYVLNYETKWMSRDEIVASTYEAGLRLNRLKADYGLVDPRQAERTEARIREAVRLMGEIDRIVKIKNPTERQRRLLALKPAIDKVSSSTVCEKSELNLPVSWAKFNWPRILLFLLQEWWATTKNRFCGKF